MTVIINKPGFNLRDALVSLKKKTGTFGEALLRTNTGADFDAIANLQAMPLPYWEAATGDPGQSNSYTFLDSGNRRYYTANNGNNGPNMRARMHGVLRGAFEVSFTCSYSWGWAGIHLHPESNFDPKINWAKDSSGQIVYIYNNSSNNLCYAEYRSVPGGSLTTTTQIAGQSSGLFKVWRNVDGNMYFRPPTGTDYFLFKTQENMYVTNQPQSPTWTQLESVICKGFA